MAEIRNTGGPGWPERMSDETMLDDAFATARSAADAPVPAALLARVVADAERLRPRPSAALPKPGPFAALLAALGGWPALGGLATAGVTGFWLGLAPPAAVEDLGLWSAGEAGSAFLLPDDYLADIAEG